MYLFMLAMRYDFQLEFFLKNKREASNFKTSITYNGFGN